MKSNDTKDIMTISADEFELLSYLLEEEGIETSAANTILPRENPADLPLSFAQQRLWFLDQYEPGSPLFNIPAAIRVTGRLDASALERSLNEVVRRHEALRTSFKNVNGQPVQVITENAELPLAIMELSALAEPERDARVRELADEEARRPFDLTQSPMLRTTLLRLGSEDHVLLMTMHHIASDEWSRSVLIREVAILYDAFSNGRPSPLPPLPIQYADFAYWQRQYLQDGALNAQLSYWKQQLENLPILELPTDRPRPAVQSFRGTYYPFTLDANLSQAIKELSQREQATLFMTLLAAFKVLIHRYTRDEDVVIGAPIASRNQAETEDLIGFFINMLILRTDLSGTPTFREVLARVREVTLNAMAHQELPFEKLVDELKPERDQSHPPLAQVVFNFMNIPKTPVSYEGLRLSRIPTDTKTAKYDLVLSLSEKGDTLGGYIEYNIDLFDEATIKRMSEHFQILLEAVVADPDQLISRLPVLTEVERQKLLVEWNQTETDYTTGKCLHELFETAATKSPDQVALVFDTQSLKYGELNSRANKLARVLQREGVAPEVLVGILMERSLEMVTAILAVLKAGGAYLPLEPDYPKERLDFMLDDARPAVLLVQSRYLESLPQSRAKIICVDDDWNLISAESDQSLDIKTAAENPAYVIYTSGSTGKPKGVVVTHANVARLFAATDSWFHFDERDVWTLFHSYAFDFSVWELWGALLYGGRLVIVPYWVSRSPEAFYDLLHSEQVTILNQTPSAFRQLMQNRRISRRD